MMLFSGILLAVLFSCLLSAPFPNLSLSKEVLARTEPSLPELFVALATGFVAGYAKVRTNIGGALYAVAVKCPWRETDITPRQIRLVEQLLIHRTGVPVILAVNITPVTRIKDEAGE
jgi:hypothetical protein